MEKLVKARYPALAGIVQNRKENREEITPGEVAKSRRDKKQE